MPNGILVIDKPADWTSMDVCAKVRGLLGEKRVGHGGTLDPMATGVLPVFVGRATRAVPFVMDSKKEYIAGLKLGVVTDTQDITGTILEQRAVKDMHQEVLRVLERFRGEILQVPPMYSAVKVKGKKLYELARKGEEVERAPRLVTIYSLELLKMESPCDFVLRVCCSKGTYVRTLCHDMGQALGCGGVLSSLRRTMAGGFTQREAISLETLAQAAQQGEAEKLLLPVDSCFSHCPAVSIGGRALFKARNGNPFPWQGEEGIYRVYDPEGNFLLLGRCESGEMKTIKSFFEVS